MRVINADKLIDELHQGICCDSDLKEDYEMLGIDDYINSQPTVYNCNNIDNIINIIKHKKATAYLALVESTDKQTFTRKEVYEEINKVYSSVLDIIIGGGVNELN
jgi:hypothetical protein